MKKRIIALFIGLALLLTACGSNNPTDGSKGATEEKAEITIGILQLMSHPSLDKAREGFVKEIDNLSIKAKIDHKDAQGDVSIAKQIADKFASDKVDLIYAIATPAAQSALAATQDIPILFSAVTDPLDAKLVENNERPGANLSGTSDMVDINSQLKLFNEIDENIKTIGVIYSADENNSLQQLKLVEEKSEALGLKVKSVSIQNLSDIPQALASIEKNIDGLYLLSDNKVSSSVSLVTERMKEKKIPVVATVEADVDQGGLISLGIDYEELGKITGQMAKEILVDKKNVGEIPVYYPSKFVKKVNIETIDALGLDKNLPVFR